MWHEFVIRRTLQYGSNAIICCFYTFEMCCLRIWMILLWHHCEIRTICKNRPPLLKISFSSVSQHLCLTYLTYSLRRVRHSVEGAERTVFLHPRRSEVSSGTSPGLMCRPLRSSSTLSSQRRRGLPRGLVHPACYGGKSHTSLGGRWTSIRWRWPNQRKRRCETRQEAGGCWVLSRMVSFLTKS